MMSWLLRRSDLVAVTAVRECLMASGPCVAHVHINSWAPVGHAPSAHLDAVSRADVQKYVVGVLWVQRSKWRGDWA